MINLFNKETLLFIYKVLVNFRLEVSLRVSLAFLVAYNSYIDEFIFFSNLIIIYNSSLVNYG